MTMMGSQASSHQSHRTDSLRSCPMTTIDAWLLFSTPSDCRASTCCTHPAHHFNASTSPAAAWPVRPPHWWISRRPSSSDGEGEAQGARSRLGSDMW